MPRGNVRAASFTSPPMYAAVCQPPYANSTGTMAAPKFAGVAPGGGAPEPAAGAAASGAA